MTEKVCDSCMGNRLKPYSLAVKIGDYNIIELTNLSIDKLKTYLQNLKLQEVKKKLLNQSSKKLIVDYNS